MYHVDIRLSEEQERFCQAYAANPNAAAAARSAYPSLAAAGSDISSERGRRLLKLQKIQRRVAELRGDGSGCRVFASLGELERIAAVAFDHCESDLRRFLALKTLGAGLVELQERRRSTTGQTAEVVIRIEFVE